MALTCAIETGGWSMAVTGDWGATSGAWPGGGDDRTERNFEDGGVDQFPLDPNGTPKVVLRVKRQGYARKVDRSVEPSVSDIQTIVATKAIRKPYPDQTDLDETDNGDGTRTVRLALSEYVYDGDEIVDVTFASGWKAGETGGVVSSVANASTSPLPVAISRCIQPHWELVRGTTLKTFEYLIASHHPRHAGIELHQAVSGASVTVTDGTNTVGPFWGSVGVSDRGDGLLCWKFDCDLDGLDAGPVSVNFTSYPWIGASRSTGSAHSTDTTNGLPLAWDAPQMLCYDPDGDLYPAKHVFVDAANGSSTSGDVTVADTLAAAKLGTAAADIKTAIAALYSANYSMPARNGWDATSKRAFDWCTITLAEGGQVWGTASTGLNAATHEGYLVIQGDPAAVDPRNSCVLLADGTAESSLRSLKRFWFQDLTIEQGNSSNFLFTTCITHIENVECHGATGFEAEGVPSIFNGDAVASGYAQFSASRSRWWKYGAALWGSRRRFLLLRSVEATRTTEAMVQVNCSKPDDGIYDRSGTAFGGWNSSGLSVTDQMIWGCTAFDWRGEGITAASCRESGAGSIADPTVYTRLAVVNVLVEGSAGRDPGARFFRVGVTPERMRDSIFEGLTVVGYAFNGFYDGGSESVGSSHVKLHHSGNRVANLAVARMAIKGDIFLQDGSLTGNWPHLYGTGYKSNVNGNRTSSEAANFQYAYFGLNSATDTDYANTLNHDFFGFADDKSGSAGAGNGDYTPDAGSILIGRGAVANIAADIAGTARGAVADSGAVESGLAPTPGHAALQPDSLGIAFAMSVPVLTGHGAEPAPEPAAWNVPAARMAQVAR